MSAKLYFSSHTKTTIASVQIGMPMGENNGTCFFVYAAQTPMLLTEARRFNKHSREAWNTLKVFLSFPS